MNSYHQDINFFSNSLGILTAMIATAVLFVALPLLTQLPRHKTEYKEGTQIIIQQRRTLKPLETKKKIEPDKPKEIQKEQTQKNQAKAPKFEMLYGMAAGAGIGGTVKIGMVSDGSLQGSGSDLFKVPASLYASAYKISEVDQPPKVLRRVDPQYPFLARRNNIEGKVILRFIVDSEGNILEPQVTFSEPEGVFDQAAIDCILKWKIKPAIKDNKSVDCIAIQSIGFTLR